jgi:hypothetical protein
MKLIYSSFIPHTSSFTPIFAKQKAAVFGRKDSGFNLMVTPITESLFRYSYQTGAC